MSVRLPPILYGRNKVPKYMANRAEVAPSFPRQHSQVRHRRSDPGSAVPGSGAARAAGAGLQTQEENHSVVHCKRETFPGEDRTPCKIHLACCIHSVGVRQRPSGNRDGRKDPWTIGS